MTELELRTLGNDCYAAFNSVPPPPSSRAWALWAEVCANVPLAAAVWIRSRIIEGDSLPRNFGKAVLGLFREWRVSQNSVRVAGTGCPDCDQQLPGFFYAWRKKDDGRVHSALCRCRCNTDPCFDQLPAMTKQEAEARGFAVMPPAWESGPAGFETTRFPREGKVHGSRAGQIGETAKYLACNPIALKNPQHEISAAFSPQQAPAHQGEA